MDFLGASRHKTPPPTPSATPNTPQLPAISPALLERLYSQLC